MTYRVAEKRDALSAYWHQNMNIWMQLQNCGFATQDRYQAFCVAKDQLQDTAEALLRHRESGFRQGAYVCNYIEVWGIFQAVIIQQDAILEMRYALTGDRKIKRLGPAWKRIRDARNLYGGHPNLNDQPAGSPRKRSALPRLAISYERMRTITYTDNRKSHRNLELGSMLDDYDREAAHLVHALFEKLQKQIGQGGTQSELSQL